MWGMPRFASLALLSILTGCLWEHGKGGGGGGDDVCVQTDFGEPAIAPAPLRDPGNLTCTSFGGGCNSDCGPCPEASLTPPIPSWGICGSGCESLGPGQCATTPECRVVKDANCSIGQAVCLTDFMGCFPTDMQVDVSINCFTADAWDCSRNRACEAHHAQHSCPDVDCPRPFATCVPTGVAPGHCTGQVTCRALQPTCPAGTTPGIANGCFTGACIVMSECS
jgi:hypothetical protein